MKKNIVFLLALIISSCQTSDDSELFDNNNLSLELELETNNDQLIDSSEKKIELNTDSEKSRSAELSILVSSDDQSTTKTLKTEPVTLYTYQIPFTNPLKDYSEKRVEYHSDYKKDDILDLRLSWFYYLNSGGKSEYYAISPSTSLQYDDYLERWYEYWYLLQEGKPDDKRPEVVIGDPEDSDEILQFLAN